MSRWFEFRSKGVFNVKMLLLAREEVAPVSENLTAVQKCKTATTLFGTNESFDFVS